MYNQSSASAHTAATVLYAKIRSAAIGALYLLIASKRVLRPHEGATGASFALVTLFRELTNRNDGDLMCVCKPEALTESHFGAHVG
jgi:hypothetical protein